MRYATSVVVALLCCLAAVAPLRASPVSLTLTLQSASAMSVLIDVLDGLTASSSTSITGTQDLTLDSQLPPAGLLRFDGGQLFLADQSLLIDLGEFGGVNAGIVGFTGSALTSTSGEIPLTYVGGGFEFSFDPGHFPSATTIPLYTGIMTYVGTGSLGSLVGSGSLDFIENLDTLRLPPMGPVGILRQQFAGSSGGSSSYDVLLTAPLSYSSEFTLDGSTAGVPVQLKILGNIVGSGQYVVIPEPATVVLLALGGLLLAPLWRHWSVGRHNNRGP